jgi:hypothetical protein
VVILVVSLLATVVGAEAAIALVASSTMIGLAVRRTVQGEFSLFCLAACASDERTSADVSWCKVRRMARRD